MALVRRTGNRGRRFTTAAVFILVAAAVSTAPDTVEQLERHRNLGKAFYENPTTHAEAVEEFRRALQLAPDSPRERLNYGLALLRAARTAEGIAELERVQQADPKIPHTWFNLGIELKKAGENERAIEQFRGMLALTPDEAKAHYNLAALLKLTGDTERAVTHFEAAARLDPNLAAPHFQLHALYRARKRTADAQRALAEFQRLKKLQEGAAVPEDVDWSFYSEVLDVMADRPEPDAPAPLRFTRRASNGPHGVRGDFDNDGRLDLCRLENGRAEVLRATAAGWTKAALPVPDGTFSSCLWLDYDHDYDLDLILLGARAVLLRNAGPAGWSDRTADLPFAAGNAVSAAAFRVVADEKGFDFVVAYSDRPGVLYRDRLAGRYTAEDLPLPAGAHSLAAADLTGDGWIDVLYAREGRLSLLRNADGRFAAADVGPAAGAFAVADLENRGVEDIATAGAVLRNSGNGEFTRIEVPGLPSCVQLAAADINRDGLTDLVCDAAALVNATPTKHASIVVELTGVKNLKTAPLAEVEVKSGTRYAKRIYRGEPLVIGLGSRRVTDTVRITWPNGLIQNEVRQPAGVHRYEEAQRLSGSCPMVWTWNGREFEYITDVLGVAPLGASAGGGEYFAVDNQETILIAGESLQPRDGRYELRITEELAEVAYIDRLRLTAVDHPVAEPVHPDEKFQSPPFSPARLVSVRDLRRPVAARDGAGRDVLARILRRDAAYPDGFRRTLSGTAELHALEVDFGDAPADRATLVLHGWVDWADGSTFIAASQGGGPGQAPPKLQVRDRAGRWQTVIEDMGMPAGKPKTIVVDLAGKFLSASRAIRIVTNLCVYWDEIALAESVPAPQRRSTAVPLASAALRFRGFSPVTVHPARLQPERFTYTGARPWSMWNPTPGLYTRYGDVAPLLDAPDDRMLIMGSGDEAVLLFDARALPPLKPGWRRDFILTVDGWAKDRDANTAHSQTVEPLPFRGMSRYPYPSAERFPDTPAHRRWRAEYNTRPALRLIQPLAAAR